MALLEFYVSGFWPWLGMTIGLWTLFAGVAAMVGAVVVAFKR